MFCDSVSQKPETETQLMLFITHLVPKRPRGSVNRSLEWYPCCMCTSVHMHAPEMTLTFSSTHLNHTEQTMYNKHGTYGR